MPERSKGSHSRCDVAILEGSNPSSCIFYRKGRAVHWGGFGVRFGLRGECRAEDRWVRWGYNFSNPIIEMKRNARKIQLPEKFAWELLDCEIEYKLSDRPSKDLVKNLIQLYTQGVEYYESIRSHKYLYFQQKMTDLFTTASTIEAISKEPQPEEADSPLKRKMRSEKQQEKIEAIQIKQKQERMMNQVVLNTDSKLTATKVKEMLNDNEMKSMETTEKVKKEISTQDEKLKAKLEKRKSKAMLSKSFSSAGVIGEADTRQTLFADTNIADITAFDVVNPKVSISPLNVDFGNVINEDDSDEDEAEVAARRRMSISQDPNKKVKSELNLLRMPDL